MNIQIFGLKNCFETKKAERYFKERNIKYQFIDIKQKTMSRGEFSSVFSQVDDVLCCVNPKSSDKETVSLLKYLRPDDRYEKLFENQHVLLTPVVRNGRLSTFGYKPDVWKTWE